MRRLMLNDELWSKLRESMLQHKIYDKPILQRVEAMLYRMRVGCPWRDLVSDGLFIYVASHLNRATKMLLLALSPKLDDKEEQ